MPTLAERRRGKTKVRGNGSVFETKLSFEIAVVISGLMVMKFVVAFTFITLIPYVLKT